MLNINWVYRGKIMKLDNTFFERNIIWNLAKSQET